MKDTQKKKTISQFNLRHQKSKNKKIIIIIRLLYHTCSSHEDQKILLSHTFSTFQSFSALCKVLRIHRPMEISAAE